MVATIDIKRCIAISADGAKGVWYPSNIETIDGIEFAALSMSDSGFHTFIGDKAHAARNASSFINKLKAMRNDASLKATMDDTASSLFDDDAKLSRQAIKRQRIATIAAQHKGDFSWVNVECPRLICEDGEVIEAMHIKMKSFVSLRDILHIELSTQNLTYIRAGMRVSKEDTADKSAKMEGVRWREDRHSWLARRDAKDDDGVNKRQHKTFRPADRTEHANAEALDEAQRWARGEEFDD